MLSGTSLPSVHGPSVESGDIKSLVQSAMGKIEKLFESRGSISGLSTGLIDLDVLTDGLHAGEMVVVAHTPPMAKAHWRLV